MAEEAQVDGKRARPNSFSKECFNPTVEDWVRELARDEIGEGTGTDGGGQTVLIVGIPNYGTVGAALNADPSVSGSGIATVEPNTEFDWLRAFVKRPEGLYEISLGDLIPAPTIPVQGTPSDITHYTAWSQAVNATLILPSGQIARIVTVDVVEEGATILKLYLRVAAGFYGIVTGDLITQ